MENAKQSSKPNMSLPCPEELGTGRVSHAETCLFWRCARRVLDEGNPASDNVVVCVQLGLLLGFPPSNLREDGPILATPRQRRTEACLTP